ncbi:MAG TPA: hypothetical protein VG675_12780 [Bryobacteraceae bacterium]|nr:hypothetical protein [Bryobacteraceae bacterium]
MIIQHVIKGINGIDDAMARHLLDSGIKCLWWVNNDPLPFHEVPLRLNERNLDWHQNQYKQPDPLYPDAANPNNEPFHLHTPFVSATAGTVDRDAYQQTNTLTPAWEVALKFATDFWKSDGYLFYCYVFVIGKPAVGQQSFSEELRELNVYPGYSNFQPEGEITAKIVIPPAQIERAEFWSSQDAKTARDNKKLPAASRTLYGKHYVAPQDFNNVRDFLK